MKFTAVMLSVFLVVSGCASRSQIQDDNPIKGISNLYNRNFVVAVPTYFGNLVCGTPFFFISGGIDAIYSGKRSDAYYNSINNAYLVPASVCGAATGAVFIPFSYLCAESAWDFDFKVVRNQSFSCH